MKIGRYIYAKLMADTGFRDLVDNRVSPVYAPEQQRYPNVVYSVQNSPWDKQKDHPASADLSYVTFHVWADYSDGQSSYDVVDDIDGHIRRIFDFQNGTIAGVTVMDCEYISSKDARDDERILILREIEYKFVVKNIP